MVRTTLLMKTTMMSMITRSRISVDRKGRSKGAVLAASSGRNIMLPRGETQDKKNKLQWEHE
jgi:hypothetical protein